MSQNITILTASSEIRRSWVELKTYWYMELQIFTDVVTITLKVKHYRCLISVIQRAMSEGRYNEKDKGTIVSLSTNGEYSRICLLRKSSCNGREGCALQLDQAGWCWLTFSPLTLEANGKYGSKGSNLKEGNILSEETTHFHWLWQEGRNYHHSKVL